MAQNNIDFSGNPTGAELLDDYLDKELQNILTSNSGIQRPSYAVSGTKWLDLSVTPWLLKVYDGTDDTIIGTIDPSTHKFIVSNPLTTTGDLLVQGADGKPNRLASGTSESVLTSNGVGQIPSYKVNPIGVKSYLSTYSYKKDDVVVAVVEDETTLYKSLIDNNKGNALTDENSWEKVSLGGGGLEIGDIGFAPLGINETQNKRRYLNGQIISQTQFASFTTKVKAAISLYPSLSATEENWQAEVTNSKLGQCGKFVIDDTAGTIRLPKVVNINGLTDLSLIGGIKAESLPNITGTFRGRNAYNGNASINESVATGAFGTRDESGTKHGAQASGTNSFTWTFDASRSSSTYQDNAPVQQEAVQYPYFIQVATGSEESVDVTREIELNNPFFFGMHIWSDTAISNASWLISNGSYHSGATYVEFYEWLLKIHNGTLTVDGVSIKTYGDSDITDYDYVINTADTTFRLPVKVKLASGNAVVGNGMTLGLTDGTNNSGLTNTNQNNLQPIVNNYGLNTGSATSTGASIGNVTIGVTTDPTKSGIETSSQGLKLYFYVGETIQDANVINAAGVLTRVAELSNEYIVGLGMPDYDAGVSIVLNASTPYIAEFNGWLFAAANGNIKMLIDGKEVYYAGISGGNTQAWGMTAFVSKGQKVTTTATITARATIYPFKGAN